MESITWIIEIAVTALLIVALWRAARLERALSVLRQDRSALEAAVMAFQDSAGLAEEGARKLRKAADDADAGLVARLKIVDTMHTELTYLSERGDALAAQLEGLIRASRPAIAAFDEANRARTALDETNRVRSAASAPVAPTFTTAPVFAAPPAPPSPKPAARRDEEHAAPPRFAATRERELEILRALGLSK